MRPAKSNPQLNNNNNNNQSYINNYHRNNQQQHSPNDSMSTSNQNWTQANQATQKPQAPSGPTSPICRCRVMYLGSSVPLITKDGLQGIQEPLRKLYPMDKASGGGGGFDSIGIDSWLSVWSNGILIENVDENGREVKRFFKIGALHYCAAVKYIPPTAAAAVAAMAMTNGQNPMMYSTLPNNPNAIMQQQQNLPRFLPLDSPYARQIADSSPPIFASILRRTTGIKVLECHAFICKREAAANALVRCCFHAYADTMYAKQIGADVSSLANEDTNDHSGTSFQETEHDFGAAAAATTTTTTTPQDHRHQDQLHHHSSNGNGNSSEPSRLIARSRSKSIAALNGNQSNSDYRLTSNGGYAGPDPDYCSLAENQQHQSDNYSMNGRKSSVEQYQAQQQQHEIDWNGNSNLKKQQKQLSKSMHYLNYQNGDMQAAPTHIMNGGHTMMNQPDGYPIGMLNPCFSRQQQQQQDNPLFWAPKQSPSSQPQQPFYNNPYASRVPSYPPAPPNGDQMDSANGGGTLKSIRSMAANSIASTLLRSKRHAKSMAQLNKDKIISFHQPQMHHMSTQAHTMMVPPVMLPPVPPMFLPNLPANGIMNGSQTMKLPNRSMVHPMMLGQPMNFETMTPKEMKKLLKKSAKYGLPPPNLNHHQIHPVDQTNGLPLLPLPPRQTSMLQNNGSDGTLPLRPPSIYSDVYNGGGGGSYADMSPDMAMAASMHGLPPPNMDQQQQMGPILVKPNQEFLKSKAGKKWLKQQKEFKKLLPPHLDGLPIIFGPPPPDALEAHQPPGVGLGTPGRNNNILTGCDSGSNIDQRHRIYY